VQMRQNKALEKALLLFRSREDPRRACGQSFHVQYSTVGYAADQ
jgi:hypothetical protein